MIWSDLFHYLVVASVTTLRISALFITIPIFGQDIIPGLIRSSLILGFSVLLMPMIFLEMPMYLPIDAWEIGGIVVKEIGLGVMMGLLIGVPFWVASGVGAFFDTQRGTSIGSIYDPLMGQSVTPTGTFLLRWFTVLYFVSGGFGVTLELVYRSYKIWPLFSFFPEINPRLWLYMGEWIDTLMTAIIVLASPMILGMFLVQLGLGLMNRFSPQLNVFMLSMPIMSGVGMFILILYINGFGQLLMSLTNQMLNRVLELTQVLGGGHAG